MAKPDGAAAAASEAEAIELSDLSPTGHATPAEEAPATVAPTAQSSWLGWFPFQGAAKHPRTWDHVLKGYIIPMDDNIRQQLGKTPTDLYERLSADDANGLERLDELTKQLWSEKSQQSRVYGSATMAIVADLVEARGIAWKNCQYVPQPEDEDEEKLSFELEPGWMECFFHLFYAPARTPALVLTGIPKMVRQQHITRQKVQAVAELAEYFGNPAIHLSAIEERDGTLFLHCNRPSRQIKRQTSSL